MGITVRELGGEETDSATELCWEVFKECEAPDYTEFGTEEFCRSIHNRGFISQLRYFGAFDGERMTGVIAIRERGHIALFFVKGEYHGRGIGRRLFERAEKECGEKITVNSSPYALKIYRRLGFKETDSEQSVNGLRFTPMEYRRKKQDGADG